MLGLSLHGRRTLQHPVHSAGAGDNTVFFCKYCVYCVGLREIREFLKNTFFDGESHFQTPFAVSLQIHALCKNTYMS